MKGFNISNNTMVVTSKYVTEHSLNITEVSHEDDEEGGSLWQFHCGNGDYSMSQMQLVRLDTILAIDPSVIEVCDLEMGATARRIEKGLPWEILI
jgi:hypothetical protein